MPTAIRAEPYTVLSVGHWARSHWALDIGHWAFPFFPSSNPHCPLPIAQCPLNLNIWHRYNSQEFDDLTPNFYADEIIIQGETVKNALAV
jgi:hypothetical protein